MVIVIDMEVKNISAEIENARNQLIALGNSLGLQHPDVVRSSECLDELLLQYYKDWK